MTDEVAVNVLCAVKGVREGDMKGFNALTTLLTKADKDTLCSYVIGLQKSIQFINKDHETIVGIILNIDWSLLEQSTVNIVIEFLVELVSAKTYFLKPCVNSLLKQFLSKSQVCEDELIRLNDKFRNIHATLEAIVHLIPIANQVIIDNVAILFPYIGKGLFILETYIVNILQISTYAKDTRYRILSLIIDKLLSIDVRIPRQNLESNEDEEFLQFEDKIDTSRSNGMRVLTEDIAKLDQLMVIVFTYINSLCHHNGSLDMNYAELFFKELLLIYDGVILQTQQSTHVQFVLFYTASFHQKFCEEFIGVCWSILENPNKASITRRAASSYLSSFIARANFVHKPVIKTQIFNLARWIHRYLDIQNSTNIIADFNKHGPFYGVCQTLLYIFIYHHKIFLQSHADIDFIKSLNFARIITSKLNPLKFCLNTIVSMFARVTRIYEIVFCYSVIERNNRSMLSEFTLTNGGVHKHLEIFFPFDPYMLPNSLKFIKPVYLEWTGTIDESDSDDDSADEGNLNDESVEQRWLTHASVSIDMKCVSPGFSLLHHEM